MKQFAINTFTAIVMLFIFWFAIQTGGWQWPLGNDPRNASWSEHDY